MRVLFAAPAHVGFAGLAGGVLKEMSLRERSLTLRGHEVCYVSPWERPAWDRFSVAHLFMANGDTCNLGMILRERLPLVVSPIIDRVESDAVLRCSAWLDRLVPRVYTHLGRCAALCRAADWVCVRSREEERRLRRGLGVHTPCNVLPCPIALPAAEPEPLLKPPAFQAKRPFVVFIGDAGNPRKNVLRLIQALDGTGLDLVIVGEMSASSQKGQVLAMANRLDWVHCVGLLLGAQLSDILRRARALVLPSLMEGIGLAAVEAAVHGTTVVVTRHGGPPDYFGEDAYYVDPYSIEDIRRQILAAVAHPRDASAGLKKRLGMERAGELLEACYVQCIEAAQERLRRPAPAGCRTAQRPRTASAA